jgi:hypothetical protein
LPAGAEVDVPAAPGDIVFGCGPGEASLPPQAASAHIKAEVRAADAGSILTMFASLERPTAAFTVRSTHSTQIAA